MTVYTKALAASASLILLVTAHCRALSQNPAAPGTRKPAATLSQPVAKPAHPRVVVPRPSLPPQSGSGGNGYNDYREFNSEGMRLQSEGKLDEAAEQYRKALQLKPSSSAAHNNLALVLKDLGDFAAAEKEARFALRLKPDRGDYHFNLGMILEKQSKFSEARQEYSQAVKADAMDAESHFRLAQVLLAGDSGAEAEPEIKLALLLKPNNFQYHILYGDILKQLGHRDEEALNEYRRAEELVAAKDVPADLRNKIDLLRQALQSR